MSNPKFDYYLTTFGLMLSRFSRAIDNKVADREGIGELPNSRAKLKNIAEAALEKQKEQLATRGELREKFIILDKASLLKHFTSSIVVEENGHLVGVMLNKANGETETIRVPLDDVKAKEDLLNRVRSQYGL